MYEKINSDLFIGSQELNRLVKSLDESGFREFLRQNSLEFGIINSSKNGDFTNSLVEIGTNVGTIKHAEIKAIDVNGQLIYREATDNIACVDDSLFKWLKISHTNTSLEVGTVSISASGDLTGVGTEFLKVLRGQPNNASRIRLSGSALNTAEYDVVSVISDTASTLAGDFTAESGLKLVVIGTFTPDTVTPDDSKEIFQYDGCTLTLVNESVLNTPPTLVDGEEFLLARIKRTGATITIQDKRSLNIYKTKASYDLANVVESTNPLIGVDGISFDDHTSPRDKNKVTISWGIRCSNFTIDSSANRCTLIGIVSSGKYKTTADMVDGALDGWRVYTEDGSYSIVKQSALSAGQINLILDTLDVDKFGAQELTIVPNAEEIELQFDATGTIIPSDRFIFNISKAYAKIPLLAFGDTATYTVNYKYKNFSTYSELVDIGTDAIGYYDEDSYESDGSLKANVLDRTLVPYTNGLILLTRSSTAYSNTISGSGDRFGSEYLSFSNLSPVYDFEVGSRKQYVILNSDDDSSDSDYIGANFTLTANHFINLITDAPGAGVPKNGNSFTIQIRGDIDVSTFSIQIVEDWVSVGDPGTVLMTLTAHDITQAVQDNLLIHCLFNEFGHWQVYKMIHNSDDILDDIDAAVKVSAAPNLLMKVINIGDWDMDSSASVGVAHGIDFTKIRSISGIIRRDDNVAYYPIGATNDGTGNGDLFFPSNTSPFAINSTTIVIARLAGGVFDGVSFDSTGFNRGWLTIVYEE